MASRTTKMSEREHGRTSAHTRSNKRCSTWCPQRLKCDMASKRCTQHIFPYMYYDGTLQRTVRYNRHINLLLLVSRATIKLIAFVCVYCNADLQPLDHMNGSKLHSVITFTIRLFVYMLFVNISSNNNNKIDRKKKSTIAALFDMLQLSSLA